MEVVRSIKDDVLRLSGIIEEKPQTDEQHRYYKQGLITLSEIHEAIQDKIDLGVECYESKILGIIPIKTVKVLDNLDIARLKMDLLDNNRNVFNYKQYFEQWNRRKKEDDIEIDKITRECNSELDNLLKKAENTSNPRLMQGIADYKNPENDQMRKNLFYLFVKMEVNNAEVAASKKQKKR